jgi:DNA-binding CsgD family transcriptional regulator
LVAQVDCSDEPAYDDPTLSGDFWDACWNSRMSVHHRASGGSAAKLTDFYTRRQLTSTEPDVLGVYALSGRWDVFSIDVTDDVRRTRKFILAGLRPFRERDRTVLDLLRPTLALRIRTATRTGAATARLTRREREIMRLVAEGCSNKEVAWHLCLSAATVGKHLEHVYEKLSVTNRTAAVAALGE